jgi:hypothetical protein
MSGPILETGLSTSAHDFHRAIASLQEELEAIDYYNQRADRTTDTGLEAVLLHNRNDEMEHAAMLLEGLRRNSPEFALQLKKFLFTTGDLVILAKGAVAAPAGGSLGLGNLEGIGAQEARP